MSKVKYLKSKVTCQLSNVNCQMSGQVLFEILLAVAVIVGVVAVSVQLSQISLQSAKTAGERTVATNLAREAFEAMRSISAENWATFYGITKGSQYHSEIQSNKWVLIAGSESIVLSGETYVRYMVVDNISRNPTSGDIESTYNASNEDPSTQKITATIEKSGLPTITYSEYISRWRNASPVQQSWQSGSGQSSNPTSGDSTNFNNQYSSDDNNIDFTSTAGSLKIKTQ